MRNPRLAVILLVVIGAGFAAGTLDLLRTRYEQGDVYPPYSSLRADPLGTRALHDALRDIPGLEVRRNFEDPGRIEGRPGLTVLVFGMNPGEIRSGGDPVQALESLALGGARVVATLTRISSPEAAPEKKAPADRDAADPEPKSGTESKSGPKTEPGPKPESGAKPETGQKPEPDAEPEEPDGPPSQRRLRPATARWGFELESVPLPRDEHGGPVAVAVSRRGAGSGPASLPWHSPLCFRDLAAAWQVIYEREGRPVLIERPFGAGRLVLSSDSYFVSNEALREDPRAGLLVRLLGTPGTVVIDETHLGIAEARGIAALARRYRLGPAVAILALLAALVVWRAVMPLVPRAGDVGADDAVAGRDAAEGLVRLLQRGIRASGMPRACVEEWRRSFGRSHAGLADALDRIHVEHRDPVVVCRDMHRLVARGKGDHER